jgi:hypothetical protein
VFVAATDSVLERLLSTSLPHMFLFKSFSHREVTMIAALKQKGRRYPAPFLSPLPHRKSSDSHLMTTYTFLRVHLRGLVQPDLLEKTLTLLCGSVAVSCLLNCRSSDPVKIGVTVIILAIYHAALYILKLCSGQRLTDREASIPGSSPAPAPWGGGAALQAREYGRKLAS